MIKQNYNVIGVMSGTSLDGVDIAHINFVFHDESISYKLLETVTIPYSKEWVNRLKNAVGFSEEELLQLNEAYTYLLGHLINDFIKINDIAHLDAVCSHGHTVLHQPQNMITLQIGNKPFLADIIDQRVVCDFRIQDVAMGGQGAPLVPIGDKLLFKEYDFCLNLGGFSNISVSGNIGRIAFDICAVNTVLNHYANKLGYEYDDRGAIARTGTVQTALLNKLNGLLYYKLPFPKSLGFEYVKETLLPLIERYDILIQDKLATYTEHIARQLSCNIRALDSMGSLLITGGGAYNVFLIERLKELVPDLKVTIPDDKTVQYKEALIFGLLGVLRLRKEINVLANVTGAPRNHSAGYIYEPK